MTPIESAPSVSPVNRRAFLEVRIYPDQGHCFCAGSGVRRPSGRPSPSGEPPAALEAFKDIDAFCRRYLRVQPKEIDSALVSHVPVRTAW